MINDLNRVNSKWLITVPLPAQFLVKLTATIVFVEIPSMQASVIHNIQRRQSVTLLRSILPKKITVSHISTKLKESMLN